MTDMEAWTLFTSVILKQKEGKIKTKNISVSHKNSKVKRLKSWIFFNIEVNLPDEQNNVLADEQCSGYDTYYRITCNLMLLKNNGYLKMYLFYT
jgi:hypothetical protein